MSQDLVLPQDFVSADQSKELVSFMCENQESIHDRISRLQGQSIFWAAVALLEDDTNDVTGISFQVPDDTEETIFLELILTDPDNGEVTEEEVLDSDGFDGLGGDIFSLIEAFKSDLSDDMLSALPDASNPMTLENRWGVAQALFGEEAAARMEHSALSQNTAPAKPRTKPGVGRL